MLTPVMRSPARIARWIGAAPRQRGRSDAWMLKQPSARREQRRPGQDQSIGDHDQRIQLQILERLAGRGILEACGLVDRNPELERARLDRTRVQFLAAAGRTVRLGEDRDDAVLRPGERIQRRNRETRCAGESQPERAARGVICRGGSHGEYSSAFLQIAGAEARSPLPCEGRCLRSFCSRRRISWRLSSDR